MLSQSVHSRCDCPFQNKFSCFARHSALDSIDNFRLFFDEGKFVPHARDPTLVIDVDLATEMLPPRGRLTVALKIYYYVVPVSVQRSWNGTWRLVASCNAPALR